MATALTITRGDSGTLYQATINNLGSGGLTGCTLYFTVKKDASDADTAAVFQKTSKASGGINITQNGSASTPGLAQVTLTHADTTALPTGGASHLVWELRMLDANNNYITLTTGTLDVLPDVLQTLT